MLLSISALHILPEANEMYEGVLARQEAELEAAAALEAENETEMDDHSGETEEEHAAHDDHAGETEEEHAAHANEEMGHDDHAGHDDHSGETAEEHAAHGDGGHDDHGDHGGGHKFPLPFVLFECGFFLMLIVNTLNVKEKKDEDKVSKPLPANRTRSPSKKKKQSVQPYKNKQKDADDELEELEGGHKKVVIVNTTDKKSDLSAYDTNRDLKDDKNTIELEDMEGGEDVGDVAVVSGTKDLEEEPLTDDDDDHSALDINKEGLITFGLALFLHSLIDGLSVGVFQDIGSASVLAASVVIHKVPVAFTLGFAFAKSKQTLDLWSTRIILTLFLISSPLGVVLGSVISDSAYDLTLIVIQAVSSGTFVYLAACDLIVHEF